jgi:hypothetical protein
LKIGVIKLEMPGYRDVEFMSVVHNNDFSRSKLLVKAAEVIVERKTVEQDWRREFCSTLSSPTP